MPRLCPARVKERELADAVRASRRRVLRFAYTGLVTGDLLLATTASRLTQSMLISYASTDNGAQICLVCPAAPRNLAARRSRAERRDDVHGGKIILAKSFSCAHLHIRGEQLAALEQKY